MGRIFYLFSIIAIFLFFSTNISSFAQGPCPAGQPCPLMQQNQTPQKSPCSACEQTTAPGDIIDTITCNKELSTLVKALDATYLTQTLKGNGPYTLFAPINKAFDDLPGNVKDLFKPEFRPQLTETMKRHIVSCKIPAAKLTESTSVNTLAGCPVQIKKCGNNIKIDNAKVLQVICTKNGTIYVIDKVLMSEEVKKAIH